MYGYEQLLEITPEQLLQKITQEEIFEFILKRPFDFSARYCSPFRTDKRPGCRFEERRDGAILFVDFGERTLRPDCTHRTAFKMVMEQYNTSLQGAIRLLCIQFGISDNKADYEDFTPVDFSGKERSDISISYNPIPYSKADKIHWSRFYIKPDDLLEDNVFATNRFMIKRPNKIKVINIFKHCYAMDFLAGEVKIYQPFSERYRWISSCHENNIGNIDNLPMTGDELIIKKAYKDHRVLRNMGIGLNVIWLQNEGCVPDMEILVNLVGRFNKIAVFFDNDLTGIMAARKLVAILNNIRQDCARVVFLPRVQRHLTTHRRFLKDPGEFINKEGKTDFRIALKQIGIYGNTCNSPS